LDTHLWWHEAEGLEVPLNVGTAMYTASLQALAMGLRESEPTDFC